MPDTTTDLRVASNGRLVLPKAMRAAMGLTGESKVVATLEGDELRLTPVRSRALRARELYRRYAKSPRTTDDFLADRRAEAIADGDRPDAGPGAGSGAGQGADRETDMR